MTTPDPLREALEMIADGTSYDPAGSISVTARNIARAALAAQPEPLDVERLWHVLAAIGVIHSGTWVSFFHEDAVAIAAEYATLDRSAE